VNTAEVCIRKDDEGKTNKSHVSSIADAQRVQQLMAKELAEMENEE